MYLEIIFILSLSFNRYIVECKSGTVSSKVDNVQVLIDT